MVGGVAGGHAWQKACVPGGHAWWGLCVADATRCSQLAGGMHPAGMHSCDSCLRGVQFGWYPHGVPFGSYPHGVQFGLYPHGVQFGLYLIVYGLVCTL